MTADSHPGPDDTDEDLSKKPDADAQETSGDELVEAQKDAAEERKEGGYQ